MGYPRWMYRKNGKGLPDAKMFDSEQIPSGWFDSPGAAEESFEKEATKEIEDETDQKTNNACQKCGKTFVRGLSMHIRFCKVDQQDNKVNDGNSE